MRHPRISVLFLSIPLRLWSVRTDAGPNPLTGQQSYLVTPRLVRSSLHAAAFCAFDETPRSLRASIHSSWVSVSHIRRMPLRHDDAQVVFLVLLIINFPTRPDIRNLRCTHSFPPTVDPLRNPFRL